MKVVDQVRAGRYVVKVRVRVVHPQADPSIRRTFQENPGHCLRPIYLQCEDKGSDDDLKLIELVSFLFFSS